MTLIRPVLAGLAAALLTYAGRHLTGSLGYDLARILEAATSGPLLWGTAAFLFATTAGTRRRAIAGSTLLQATAVAGYHLTVLLTDRTTDEYWAFWLAGCLLAGPVLGALGFTVRHGDPRQAASGAGIAYGLIASHAGYLLLRHPPAELMTLFIRGAEEFYGPVHAADLIGLIIPMLLPAWTATRHRLRAQWPLLVFTAAATFIGATLLWLFIALAVHHLP